MSPGLDADAWNDCDVFTFPNGCHVAEVEIDPIAVFPHEPSSGSERWTAAVLEPSNLSLLQR
jgi:hypothetical protein